MEVGVHGRGWRDNGAPESEDASKTEYTHLKRGLRTGMSAAGGDIRGKIRCESSGICEHAGKHGKLERRCILRQFMCLCHKVESGHDAERCSVDLNMTLNTCVNETHQSSLSNILQPEVEETYRRGLQGSLRESATSRQQCSAHFI